MIPLSLRLKIARYKEMAGAQDLIVEEVYKNFNKAVLHGGTAIWRCYNGNRFSEDLDFYIPKDTDKINSLFKNLEKKGFKIEKKKIGKNSLFSTLEFNRIRVRFEALFISKEGFLKEYEKFDGNFITIYTLTAEDLINEKVDAYLSRLKIRDLYDIFFLLRYAVNKSKIKDKINSLIQKYKKPIDEDQLKILIIEGIAPHSRKIIEYIKGYRL